MSKKNLNLRVINFKKIQDVIEAGIGIKCKYRDGKPYHETSNGGIIISQDFIQYCEWEPRLILMYLPVQGSNYSKEHINEIINRAVSNL